MTTKEYLNQYIILGKEIDIKHQQIQQLRELITQTTPVYSGMPCSHSGDSDKIGNTVSKIVDLQTEINIEVNKMLDVRKKISRIIANVSDSRCRILLELRYINGKTWEQIAVEMDYTYQWVCELHGRALKLVALDSN